MDNLPFVLWMLGFRFLEDLIMILEKKCNLSFEEHPKNIKVIAIIIKYTIWLGVGYLLYRK